MSTTSATSFCNILGLDLSFGVQSGPGKHSQYSRFSPKQRYMFVVFPIGSIHWFWHSCVCMRQVYICMFGKVRRSLSGKYDYLSAAFCRRCVRAPTTLDRSNIGCPVLLGFRNLSIYLLRPVSCQKKKSAYSRS
jgi:hypothetical protein